MRTAGYAHIGRKPSGTPIIKGTRISVARIALNHVLQRYRPEDIPAQYPGLTLGEVFSALAFYYDHKQEMDRLIEEDDREFLAQREESRRANAEFLARLKTRSPRS
jgi:uncharacterized protein (DUF433 family)